MSANVYWSDFYHRVLILELTVGGTHDGCTKFVKESVNMLNSVRHKVAIVIDFSQSKNEGVSSEFYKVWLDAIHQWRETSSYADFWINVNPSPWEQVILSTLGLVYNPSNSILVDIDEACRTAIGMLDEMGV